MLRHYQSIASSHGVARSERASRHIVRPLLAVADINDADWCSAFRTTNARRH